MEFECPMEVKIDSDGLDLVDIYIKKREEGDWLIELDNPLERFIVTQARLILPDKVVKILVAAYVLENPATKGGLTGPGNVDEIMEGKDISDGKPGFDGSRY